MNDSLTHIQPEIYGFLSFRLRLIILYKVEWIIQKLIFKKIHEKKPTSIRKFTLVLTKTEIP